MLNTYLRKYYYLKYSFQNVLMFNIITNSINQIKKILITFNKKVKSILTGTRFAFINILYMKS